MPTRTTPLDVLLLLTIVVAIPLSSALTTRRYASTPRSDLRLEGRYWYIIIRGIVLSLLLFVDWRSAGRPWSSLGLDIPVGFGGRVGFAIDALLAGYYVYALLLRPLSAERITSARRRLDSYRIIPRTRREFVLFPVVGIAGSIMEELLYRGFLIGMVTPLADLWVAVIVSSIIFGLGHAYQGSRGVLRTALIGFAFALGYALTHSLWWLVIAHITVSICGDLFARRLHRLSSPPTQSTLN